MGFVYKNSRGVTYFLHEKDGMGRSRKGKLFFFSKTQGEGIENVPEGYMITESLKTGLPVLKKL